MTLTEQYIQDANNKRWTMPTLSVIAVFVAKTDWCQFTFADQSRSKPRIITTGEAFVSLAHDLDSAAWAALQKALKNQDNWVPVE